MANIINANMVSYGFSIPATDTLILAPASSRHYAKFRNHSSSAIIGIRFNSTDSAANYLLGPGEFWEPLLAPVGRIYIENMDAVDPASVLFITDTATEE